MGQRQRALRVVRSTLLHLFICRWPFGLKFRGFTNSVTSAIVLNPDILGKRTSASRRTSRLDRLREVCASVRAGGRAYVRTYGRVNIYKYKYILI